MPKQKCDKKCDTPSSDSEACYEVKCEPKCDKKECDFDESECLRPEEIVCKYKDAVVEVHSEFILIGASGDVETVNGLTPLAANARADIILEGNGFFIKGHYIVAPAQLVLMPSSLTSVANRYPLLDPEDTALGTIKNQMVRASRILVSVFNVNGKGHSFVYEADLIGVDGAGDIAVLRINDDKQFNRCNPCIEKCHPFLTFGQSRCAHDGEKIYLLGDGISNTDSRLFNAVGAITEGLLSDHRYVDYSGFATQELILVSAGAYAFSAGMPILNCHGCVLGMQTTDICEVCPDFIEIGTSGASGASGGVGDLLFVQQEGIGFVGGPSEKFMRRVISSIIKGTCARDRNYNLEVINDALGSYYRYTKGYLGLAYDVFTGVDYDTTADYSFGTAFGALPRVRLDDKGQFLNTPSCKELVGFRVLGLAGVPGHFVVSNEALSVLSPLRNKLQPGDVITFVNDIAIGDLECQNALSLVTWRTIAGDQLKITYRRGGSALNTDDNGITEDYDNQSTITVTLDEFPKYLDYPWYAVNRFPLLAAPPYSFDFAAAGNQLINPQYPVPAVGGPFHPSI